MITQGMPESQKNLVQTRNPRTGKFTLIDKAKGEIISHHPRKNTPYKNITIVGGKLYDYKG
jgi:hypothetical protein